MKHKKIPGVDAPGQVTNHRQEAGSTMSVTSTTDTTRTDISVWEQLALTSHTARTIPGFTPDPTATECPEWCEMATCDSDVRHTVERRRIDRRHESASVGVVLQRHRWAASLFDDGDSLLPATMETSIFQHFGSTTPSVKLGLWELRPPTNDGDVRRIGPSPESNFVLELAEAAELAHVLLAAVDAALGLNGEVA